MKQVKIAFTAILILTFVLMIANLYATPRKQELTDARISVKAVKLHKNKIARDSILSDQKKKIEDAAVYSAKNNSASYTVAYVKYGAAASFNLRDAATVIIRMFQNNGFVYEMTELKQGDTESVLLTGKYSLNGTGYGIMAKLFKNENNFWQVIVIYQDSKRNAQTAQDFIKSAAIKLQI